MHLNSMWLLIVKATTKCGFLACNSLFCKGLWTVFQGVAEFEGKGRERRGIPPLETGRERPGFQPSAPPSASEDGRLYSPALISSQSFAYLALPSPRSPIISNFSTTSGGGKRMGSARVSAERC